MGCCLRVDDFLWLITGLTGFACLHRAELDDFSTFRIFRV